MATLVKAKDRGLFRIKSFPRIQRFNHTLKPQISTELGADSSAHQVDVSKWRKVDAGAFGLSRAMISLPSWIVLKILRQKGYQSYLVGGCVRDLLLKKVPKDFDVITTANLKQIRRQFHRCEIVGRRFPICRVHVRGSVIEVSSFETMAKHAEEKEQGHLSQIPHGCDEKDLILWRNSMHRDFTINSLFFDPFLNKIYDYVNGITDLRTLKLRTLIPAYLSFTEDCARILRGLRIAARLGFSFCRDTEMAMRSLSSSIEKLDKSRIMMELNYMLSYGSAEPSIWLLHRYNLLEILLPFHAAYLGQQTSKIPPGNSTMLMKLLFNLDKLVSCDHPADYTLWVGLLAFHQALVNFPQDAFVVWVFASVLYHGSWKKGVKFVREHAKEQVQFVPEFSGFSEIKSDVELAEKVTELVSLFQDCVAGLTATESGYVYVSKRIEKNVRQVFDVLVECIESYKIGRESFMIDYDLLGKGNLQETRFVLGKIILETISGGLAAPTKVVAEEEKKYRPLDFFEEDSVKDEIVVKKSRKRDLGPSISELKLKTAKRHLRIEKCRPFNEDITANKQEVILEEESQQIGEENQKEVETFLLLAEEIKVTEENIMEKKACDSLPQEESNKKIDKQKKVDRKKVKSRRRSISQDLTVNKQEVVPEEESEHVGEEKQKEVEMCQLLAEETKVTKVSIGEKKDCDSLSQKGLHKKIDKQKKVDEGKISPLPLSNLFKNK